MKRLFIGVIIVLVITFALPIILTKTLKSKEVASIDKKIEGNSIQENANEINDKKISNYTYSNYGEIRLLHSKTGEIETLDIDKYLCSVVSAEMPVTFEIEALKAQAIVARTYTVYIMKNGSGKHENSDICDSSSCCQAWISKEDRLNKWDEDAREENWKRIEEAVYGTQGKIITYDKEPIDAFFHSNSGGKTENVSTVWGGTDLPYLQSVETAGEDAYSQYLSEIEFTKTEFENKIKEKHSDFSIDYADKECIKVIEYTEGNRVKTIKIGNSNLSGVEVRSLLGLKSANFSVDINDNKIKFSVKGYGHGVRNEPNRSR